MAFDDDPPRKPSRPHLATKAQRPLDKGRRHKGDEEAADAQEAVERQEDATWCERKDEGATPEPRRGAVDDDP